MAEEPGSLAATPYPASNGPVTTQVAEAGVPGSPAATPDPAVNGPVTTQIAETGVPGSPAATPDSAGNGPVPPGFGQLNPTGPKKVDQSEFIQLIPRDGIEPVYSPQVQTAEQVSLDPEDLVIGVSIGGERRAYPIKTLASSEMVNDLLGGSPILVTW